MAIKDINPLIWYIYLDRVLCRIGLHKRIYEQRWYDGRPQPGRYVYCKYCLKEFPDAD